MRSTVTTWPGLGAAGVAGRHQDVLRDAPVLGHEKQHAVLACRRPTMRRFARSSTSTMPPSRPAAAVAPGHAHRHAVAVQHLAHLAPAGRNTIGPAVVAERESRSRRDGPRRARRRARCASRRAARRRGSASPRPRARARRARSSNACALALLDLEALRELVGRERRAGAVQRFQDLARVFGAPRSSAARRGRVGEALFFLPFSLTALARVAQLKFRLPCRGGGIGRRTRFRS